MSLVELMIAMTVAVIIMGAATLFIRNALKSYDNAMKTIDLQMEAQTVMEQLGNWIMEGNRAEVKADGTLVIYNIPRESGAVVDKWFIWQKDGALYLYSLSDTNESVNDAVLLENRNSRSVPENCIGDYVTGFVPSVSADKKTVTIELELKEGAQSYEVSSTVKIRNELK